MKGALKHMKYQYIELYDRQDNDKYSKDGNYWFIGKPSQELIDELELEVVSKYYDGSGKSFKTTLNAIASKGWELQFVTPAGFVGNKTTNGGPFQLCYTFRKQIDE